MRGRTKLNIDILVNKRKIFNDPVYGFITIPTDFIFQIIQDPYFQRLRRIKQLGLAELVYPGAVHSRFQHALGAMHLMTEALQSLKAKGVEISDDEFEATLLAILLHDVGHGPFSHVMEHMLLSHVPHEKVSEIIMQKLNEKYAGKLDLAISIFSNAYSRPFFYQLVSSQLDMDRLDYLNRDSFFTAVAEGKIGAERIIKMLNVAQDELVVEEKGLMSVENFLVARQHMYWQVYLHKTAICAEAVLQKIFMRVKDLLSAGQEVEMHPSLRLFLSQDITTEKIATDEQVLTAFAKLDDIDIWFVIKNWTQSTDPILSYFSTSLLNRNLFKIKFEKTHDLEEERAKLEFRLGSKGIGKENFKYFFSQGAIATSGYDLRHPSIKILYKNGKTLDITQASDLPTIQALSNIVKKSYLCYANDVYLRDY